mgnify:CR=1 FL=1
MAAPEPRISAPLLPFFELPELNTSAPLTPLTPEFVLRIVITPLVVAVPSPAATLTAPPVLALFLWGVLAPGHSSALYREATGTSASTSTSGPGTRAVAVLAQASFCLP